MKEIIKCISVFVLGCLVGVVLYWLNRRTLKPIVEVVKEIEYIDTNRVQEPVVVPELTIIEEYILIENPDLSARDTLPKIQLRKETRTYKDSTYMAVVSGYNPRLDYIETYNRIKYITTKEPPKNWQLSLVTGLLFTGEAGSFYGAGQLSYTQNRWTISGQIGRDFVKQQTYVGVDLEFGLVRW